MTKRRLAARRWAPSLLVPAPTARVVPGWRRGVRRTYASEAELDRLTAALPGLPIDTPAALQEAGAQLAIAWPAEYVHVINRHNGVEGDIGDFHLILWDVEHLASYNDPERMQFYPGLVLIGTDGGDELLALDRLTAEVLLVPAIGGPEHWLLLGSTLREAFGRMERGEVFSAPHRE